MSHIWDATLRSWRPVRSGEPGEYFWDGASWVPNTTGGDFRWQQSTQSWVPGPGGTHEWVQADRAWRPEPAEAGGEHYWNQATQSWVARTSTGFTPSSLFTSGAQGAWYDPSDYSTLFQNAAGTTPVTAVEQPVRLMLDRSKGLVLGSELVTNGGFDDATGWTAQAGWAISGGAAVGTAANAYLFQSCLTVGRWYSVTFNVTVVSGTLALRVGTFPTIVQTISITGSYTCIARASGDNDLSFQASSFTGSIDNVSVRELPGNHAVAPNDASRPILRARYNLLTNTNSLGTAWQDFSAGTTTRTPNYATAPDGTMTASRFQGNNANTWWGHIFLSNLATANRTYTFSVWARALTGTPQIRLIMLFNGGVSYQDPVVLTSDWVRYTYTVTFSAGDTQQLSCAINHGNGNDVLIWGASLLTAADQSATGGAYQRVGAATDYDTSNPVWRPYLAFDGSDDSFSTSSIDFSGTDEMTVFAGVTKLSDAARGAIIELTASAAANDGAFLLAAPNAASATFAFESKGTTLTDAVESSIAAPTTAVLTGIGDISGDVTTLRRNGTQRDSDTGDQGSGNYANAALFIGRRNNTSLPFNGRLYGLTVLGRTATAPELTAMETWIAGKTGVTLP